MASTEEKLMTLEFLDPATVTQLEVPTGYCQYQIGIVMTPHGTFDCNDPFVPCGLHSKIEIGSLAAIETNQYIYSAPRFFHIVCLIKHYPWFRATLLKTAQKNRDLMAKVVLEMMSS